MKSRYWNTSHHVVQAVESISHLDVAHAKLLFYTGTFSSGTNWAEVAELSWARSRRTYSRLNHASPSPVFCWLEAPAQHWHAARLDRYHSLLQFPPKEAEVANRIAHDFFLVWRELDLWDWRALKMLHGHQTPLSNPSETFSSCLTWQCDTAGSITWMRYWFLLNYHKIIELFMLQKTFKMTEPNH